MLVDMGCHMIVLTVMRGMSGVHNALYYDVCGRPRYLYGTVKQLQQPRAFWADGQHARACPIDDAYSFVPKSLYSTQLHPSLLGQRSY